MGSPARTMVKLNTRFFSPARGPLIMGILNITRDSFSDGGQFNSPQAALRRAKAMVAAGADILDLGAESTRPGAEPVSAQEEIRRLLPVLKKAVALGVPVSVDTYKPEVAQQAIKAGAQIINDVTGLENSKMRSLAASTGVWVVIMHMQGTPQTMQRAPRYRNVVADVKAYLVRQARLAQQAGVHREKIILDPGIGFGKKLQHNLLLLNNLKDLIKTRYPILVGPSRKRFIADVLGEMPPLERIWGTAATVALAAAQGVQIIRVHDVNEMRMVARTAHTIAGATYPGHSKVARRHGGHAA